jgi:hypothetical protein
MKVIDDFNRGKEAENRRTAALGSRAHSNHLNKWWNSVHSEDRKRCADKSSSMHIPPSLTSLGERIRDGICFLEQCWEARNDVKSYPTLAAPGHLLWRTLSRDARYSGPRLLDK